MSAISALHKSLPLVAAAYGQKMGVRVAIGGNDSDAYTDGRTIVLPNISTDKYPKEVLWGYLAHEASHIRYTDFTVRRSPGVHAALTNIIEDARIEREMVKAYPGVASDLDAIWQYLKDAGYIQDVSPDTAPVGILQMYCLYFLRCNQLGQTILKDSLEAAEEALEAAFDKGVCIRLRGILRSVPGLKSTLGAAMTARSILEMLQEEADKQDQSSEDTSAPDGNAEPSNGQGSGNDTEEDADQQDGSSDSASDDGEGGGDDAQAAGNTNAEPEDASEEGGNTPGADAEDASDTTANIKSVLQAGDQGLAPDPMDTLKQGMKEEGKGFDQPSLSIQFPDVQEDGLLNYRGTGIAEQMDMHVKATSARLQQRLLGLVEATQRKPARAARSGRRLDAKRIARVASGDMRVFKNKQAVRAPNAAVHVLVDMSGSMFLNGDCEEAFNKIHGRQVESSDVHNSQEHVDSRHVLGYTAPFQVARNATLALAQSLGRIKGVNVGATAFSGSVMPMLKHGESVNRGTIHRFNVVPWGCTALDRALLYSALALSQTKEERKVLIVLSDGAPDDGASTKYVIEQLKGHVELIGIGIQDGAIADYIDNSIIVNDLVDLEKTLMDVARASII